MPPRRTQTRQALRRSARSLLSSWWLKLFVPIKLFFLFLLHYTTPPPGGSNRELSFPGSAPLLAVPVIMAQRNNKAKNIRKKNLFAYFANTVLQMKCVLRKKRI